MKKLFYTVLAVVLLGSCFQERRMAVDYVEKFSNPKNEMSERIYVVLPENVIHTNRTLADIDGFHEMDASAQNKLIEQHTKFVDKINDSIFLSQFNEHLIYNLGRLGIPVVIVKDPAQLPKAAPDEIFILQIPQIEVEEYVENKPIEYITGSGQIYETSVPQNKFSVNLWYLFDKDTGTEKAPAYYYNWVFSDRLESNLVRDSHGNLKLHTKVNELNMNDIYAASYLSGKLTAVYYIEKIINDYLKTRKEKPIYYYFYNPEKNKITYGEVPYEYGISTFKEIKQK